MCAPGSQKKFPWAPSTFFHSSKRPKVQALFLFLWEVSLQILLSKRLELESSIFSVFVLHSKRGLCLQPRWLEEIWVGQIWSHYHSDRGCLSLDLSTYSATEWIPNASRSKQLQHPRKFTLVPVSTSARNLFLVAGLYCWVTTVLSPVI